MFCMLGEYTNRMLEGGVRVESSDGFQMSLWLPLINLLKMYEDLGHWLQSRAHVSPAPLGGMYEAGL